jgi:hypothetical protein
MGKMKLVVVVTSLLLLTSCAKDIVETADALDCAAKAKKFSENNNDLSCSELIAEINKFEKSCKAYISAESQEGLNLLKANCTDN